MNCSVSAWQEASFQTRVDCRTGCGKTLAFVLPIVETLAKAGITSERGRTPRVIVLAPTRELAKQVRIYNTSHLCSMLQTWAWLLVGSQDTESRCCNA